MKLSIIAALAAAVVAIAAQTGSKALDQHSKALKDAKAFSVAYTIQVLPGAPADYRLVLAKGGMFKLESPAKLIVSDGKTVSELDKASNTYTEGPADKAWFEAMLVKPETWVWAAFGTEQFKGLKNADARTRRVLRGIAATDVTLWMTDGRILHLYLDPKLGFARGGSIKTERGEWLILAKEAKVMAEADGSEFVFTPPAGATKAEPAKAPETTFASVAPILRSNCLPCHSSSNRAGGYDATSFQSTLRRVSPGNPDSSVLYQYLTGAKQPQMPYKKPPLGATELGTIRGWIAAGAKQ